jgi:hypothetical protein
MVKGELSLGEKYNPEPHEAEEYYAWLNGERGPLYSDSEEETEAVSARRHLPAKRRGRMGGQGFGGMSGGRSRYALEGRSGSEEHRSGGQSHGNSHAGHSRSGAGDDSETADSQAEVIAMLRIRESFSPAQEVEVGQMITEADDSPVKTLMREAVEAVQRVKESRPEATKILITEVMVGDRSLGSEVDGWN